jgi:hypothetical protein
LASSATTHIGDDGMAVNGNLDNAERQKKKSTFTGRQQINNQQLRKQQKLQKTNWPFQT